MASHLLRFPVKFPRFCDQNPAGITEPQESDKDNGFGLDAYVNSHWFNWFQNLNYEWIRALASQVVGQWRPVDLAAVANYVPQGWIYNALQAEWASIEWTTPNISGVRSLVDHTITDVVVTGTFATPVARTLRHFNGGYFFAHNNPGVTRYLAYNSTLAGAWSNSTVSCSYDISAVGTKRPLENSNFVMIGTEGDAGTHIPEIFMRTAPSSGQTAPTIGLTGGDDINCFCFLGDEAWICLTKWGWTFISTDDGDNWTITASTPESTGVLTNYVTWIDCNTETGTMVVVGLDGGIARSPNLGADWETVTIDIGSARTLGDMTKVLYVGGSCWVAVGDEIAHSGTSYAYPGIVISIDDGKTWTLPAYPYINSGLSTTTQNIVDVDCNGRIIIARTDSDYLFISNGIAGGEIMQ